MTRPRYGLAIILQSFGWLQKNKRLTEAAYELHLMKDGELLLGQLCWHQCEGIEELESGYWNLRKLDKEREVLIKNSEKADETLINAQQLREGAADRTKEAHKGLFDDRDRIHHTIKTLREEKAQVLAQARETKKRFDGITLKVSILEEEGGHEEELVECRTNLQSLKQDFETDKNRLAQIASELEQGELSLKQAQAEIDQILEGTKGESVQGFALISKANRDLSSHQASLNALSEEMNALCQDMGHFLNMNSTRPDCRAACQEYRGLLKQVGLVRTSIRLNRQLVERIGQH